MNSVKTRNSVPLTSGNVNMSQHDSESLFVPEQSPSPVPQCATAPALVDTGQTPQAENRVVAILSPQAFEADRPRDCTAATSTEEVHDPTQEQLPQHPYFCLDVHAIHNDIDAVLRDLWIALQGFEDDDTEMANQREVTQQGRQIGAPRPLVVTTVGPAGVGKSFLYKALFNRPNITKSSAEGRSCTLYPTKIVLKPGASDTTTFSDVEIELFDAATIAAMAENHVKRYYDYHFGPESDPTDDDSRRHASTAMEFFEIAFDVANNPESGPTLQSLLTAEMVNGGELFRVCVNAVEKRIAALCPLRDRKLSYLGLKDEYIDDKRKVADSLAPFVDFFIIKTGATLLRAGMTFIDLPGKSYTYYRRTISS